MTDKKNEVLKLARVLLNQQNGVFNIPKWQKQKAIDAIDEALAEQPAQEKAYQQKRLQDAPPAPF